MDFNLELSRTGFLIMKQFLFFRIAEKSLNKANVKAERMELSRKRLSNFFKDFNEFWVDFKTSVNQDKLVRW